MTETSGFLQINTDGGSRGNPGKAASAYVVYVDGEIVKKDSVYIGLKTNNEAEYVAVRNALKWLKENQQNFTIDSVLFCIDSELVVKQLNGEYKIKNLNLKKFIDEIKETETGIDKNIFYKFIRREKNKMADKLVNEELDKQI